MKEKARKQVEKEIRKQTAAARRGNKAAKVALDLLEDARRNLDVFADPRLAFAVVIRFADRWLDRNADDEWADYYRAGKALIERIAAL